MTHSSARRTFLATGAAALATGCVGCGNNGSSSSTNTSGGKDLGAPGDIPVGGGKIFADRKVVVTQPKRGEFKAFSAICTHQGCTVNQVAGGTIDCPCHGSRFDIADGTVARGPATRPLPPKKITVSGKSIRLA
ncbi:Rieske (2Fe-2S) protein [Streptomyces sp. NPDC046915]|uniref:QcrA and Rieske domain-containing protein n=1 Tax=Streptomyces sp. NPDC046915 TaxID=3155257 RepID=UPI0033C5816E